MQSFVTAMIDSAAINFDFVWFYFIGCLYSRLFQKYIFTHPYSHCSVDVDYTINSIFLKTVIRFLEYIENQFLMFSFVSDAINIGT